MRHNVIFIPIFILTLILCAQGCGQRESAVNLPDQEARQFQGLEEGKQAPGTVGKAMTPGGEFKKFFLYADQGYFKNHYIPSGWMGDHSDVTFTDSWSYDPYSRKTSIRVIYNPKKGGAGWAGIYWQEPANNWGSLKGGYDLSGARKLTFWARGEKGGEVVAEFKMGGIQGERSDTASASIGPITLTHEWKEYSIDLKDEDLSLVIGGFSFVISSMENPDGAIFYLDDIAYE